MKKLSCVGVKVTRYARFNFQKLLATFCLFVFQNSVAFADLPRTEKKICEVEEL